MSNPEADPQGQSGIPIVSAETLRALESQYGGGGQGWGERLTGMQEKMTATNPHLVRFLEMQVGKYPHAMHQPMFEVLVATMVLLESQADTDAMNASFPDFDTGS